MAKSCLPRVVKRYKLALLSSNCDTNQAILGCQLHSFGMVVLQCCFSYRQDRTCCLPGCKTDRDFELMIEALEEIFKQER